MRGDGRSIHGCSAFLYLFILHATFQITSSNEYGVPIEIKVWDTGRTPLAHMVDVTNGFGLKVLAEHNFLNENNIAFSPYGLLGILVALYEGIDGESSYQVRQAMQLPWNRNVMRVGFRDIHRTLKTYFVPEEGFLAGLALNNENVTFNEGYKKILRFYGFDLDNNEQIPTLAPSNDTNANGTAGTTPTSAMPAADSVATLMPEASTMPATTREETAPSPNPSAETLNDIDVRAPTTEPSPSLAPTAESTTTMAPTASEAPQISEAPPTTTTTQAVTEPTTTTVAPITEETTPTAERIDTESIPIQMSSTMTVTDEPTVNNEIDTTSDISSSSGSTAEMTTASTETTQAMETTPSSTTDATTTEATTPTALTSDSTSTTAASTLETFEKKKRSVVDFLYRYPPVYDPFENDYLFHRSYDIPIPDSVNPNFEANQMFLVNGLRSVQVTYMHYDTILEHAYLPHLEAAALRLPLDSDRYYLLVILPLRGGTAELGRLLARMARESDLSDVCSALRARRVRAIVPSFTVRGHITLTTDLQKLGIRDVFEPRQRDFTPMTHQAGVYVRSIEQAVSVAIRKYQATDSNNSGRYVANQHPVTFSATYPFLYFVMDASIHVSLMAGKMVDPLNTRIL